MSLDQLIPYILSAAGGGIAAYVAIRSDLAALKAQVEILRASTERAHVRIDDLKHHRES